MSASGNNGHDIRLFGGVEAVGVFDALSGERKFAGKTLVLLAYLMHKQRRFTSRQELKDLFWKEASFGSASHSLSQSLWLIRRTFGCTTGSPRGPVVLNALLESDASRFLLRADQSNDTDAVYLYRGRFLDLPDMDSWGTASRWLDHEQRRFELIAQGQLAARLAHAHNNGDQREIASVLEHAAAVRLPIPIEQYAPTAGQTKRVFNASSASLINSANI